MPEGPSIIILKEAIQQFEGKTVMAISGNAKVDFQRADGKKLNAIKTWGKHLLLCFTGFTIRIHLMLFGSYKVNERGKAKNRLRLEFTNGEVNFYAVNVKILEGDVNDHYDWTADVMNDRWNAASAKKKLKEIPEKMICDVLLDQEIFSGVGNIIKNEALYRAKVHPEAKTGDIPTRKITKIINEARDYSFDFLKWKKKGELKKNWQAYTKKKCKRCDLPIHKKETGKTRRRSFFCTNCQEMYEGK
ncbi:MAG: DNA-formamidopyrimidine glycosylase family protein [Flavobacterium sp.]